MMHSVTRRLHRATVSRVKKIIAVDPDINICSNNAAFAITLATVRAHSLHVSQAVQALNKPIKQTGIVHSVSGRARP